MSSVISHWTWCASFEFSYISATEELQEAERRREEGDSSAPTVRAQIPFTACMAALSEPEVLTDFWSSAVQAKTTATKYEESLIYMTERDS